MNSTSWKTTTTGILMVVGAIVGVYWNRATLTPEMIMGAATAALGGIGLIFARDNNVSSEAIVQKKEEKAAAKADSQESRNDSGPSPFTLFAVTTLLMVSICGVLTACKTPSLQPGGAYAPTNAVGQVVSNDLGLALADASYKFAYETALGVFRFEKEHRAEIAALSPAVGSAVKDGLDNARKATLETDRHWAAARQAYRQNPTPAGLGTLQTLLSEMQRLLAVAQTQFAPVTQVLTQPKSI